MTSLNVTFGAPPTVTGDTLTASGSIPNGAAPGTTFGAVNTNLRTPTISLASTAGQTAASSGPGLIVGSRRPDIMYRRSITLSLLASVSAGALGPTLPSVALGQTVTFPITEVGTATLTITRASGTGPLSAQEFSAPNTLLDTLTAGGGTGPYRWSNITDGSPFEAIGATSTTAKLYAQGWLDTLVQASHTFRIRVQDINGAYGYADITVNVTAFDPHNISDLVWFDPANAVTSANVVTGLTATRGATNYAMVVPSGSPAPQINTSVGPDGVSRPYLTHTGSTLPGLAAGPSYSGSSTTLGPLFSQSGIVLPAASIISVVRAANPAAKHYLAFYKASEGGGWTDTTNQGVKLGTDASGNRLAYMAYDGGGASFYPTAVSAGSPTTWHAVAGYGDGTNVFIEGDAPITTAYQGDVAPDFLHTVTQPAANTVTCDSVQIGGGSAPSAAFDWAMQIACPRWITIYERQAIHAWLARRYPIAFTPPKRKVCSGMALTLNEDGKNYVFGDKWSWEMDAYAMGAPIASLNNEFGVYVNERAPGVAAIFPEQGAYYDGTANGGAGALTIPLRTLTAAQIAWLNTGSPSPYTQYLAGWGQGVGHYTWRSSGIRKHRRFAQHLGFFEANVLLPSAYGGWPCFWLFPDAGGPFELDLGESLTWLKSYSNSTWHRDFGGSDGVGFMCDDTTANYTAFGVDWWDNHDGTNSVQFYRNREAVSPVFTHPAAECAKAMTVLLDLSMGAASVAPDAYTVAHAPYFYRVAWVRAWAYVDSDQGQPPQPLQRPTFTGTRGNTNTLTAVDGIYDWQGATNWYGLYTFDFTAGEVLVASSDGKDQFGGGTYTVLANPHSITDATAWQAKTLVWEHLNTSALWPANPILQRAYLDPATTPALTLSTTTFGSVAVGTVLATISPATLGASVAINASDSTGYFVVSLDGRQLLAGPNYTGLSGACTVNLTQTPAYGGPVLNQAITASKGSGAVWTGTWASSAYTLTNGSLTATHAATAGAASILSTASHATSGNFQFTVTANVHTTGNPLTIGVADSGLSGTTDLGADAHGCGVNQAGLIVYNGFTTGANIGQVLQGDVVTILVKAGSFYAKRNGGPWMGTSSTADPVAGTGGVSLSFLTGNAYAAAYSYSANEQFTANFS